MKSLKDFLKLFMIACHVLDLRIDIKINERHTARCEPLLLNGFHDIRSFFHPRVADLVGLVLDNDFQNVWKYLETIFKSYCRNANSMKLATRSS